MPDGKLNGFIAIFVLQQRYKQYRALLDETTIRFHMFSSILFDSFLLILNVPIFQIFRKWN